jgi:hypothetical protein
MPQGHHLDTEEQINSFLSILAERKLRGKKTRVIFEDAEQPSEKPHTEAQNNAIHLWMRQCVTLFNNNGIEKHLFLEKLYASTSLTGVWTEEAFKEDTYKPLYRAITGKESTTRASTKDHGACIDALTKWVAEHYDGLLLPPHPDRYTQGQE